MNLSETSKISGEPKPQGNINAPFATAKTAMDRVGSEGDRVEIEVADHRSDVSVCRNVPVLCLSGIAPDNDFEATSFTDDLDVFLLNINKTGQHKTYLFEG